MQTFVSLLALYSASATYITQPLPVHNYNHGHVANTPYFGNANVHSHPVSKTDPVYYCPENYELQGNSCEQILTDSAQLVCPLGFELNGDECLRRSEMLNICPAGYTKTSSGCQRVVVETALRYCPDGTTETGSGGCHREVAVNLIPQCSQGNLDGQICSWQTKVEPLAYCPDGYLPSSQHPHLNLCEQLVTYDCTHGLRRQLTMLFEQHQHPVTTHLNIQKTCTRTDVVNMQYRCPPGSSPSHDGHHCIQIQQMQPNLICPASGDVNNCYRLESLAIITECPAGTNQRCSPTGGCVCERIEPMAFTQSCPESFSDIDGSCHQLAEAKVVCPAGYVLQGDICIKTLRQPASCEFTVTYKCEGGCVFNS